ncbi:N-acetyltransferase [Longimycelium tulufanense]|uniref:N-acetyltransferase n=1 Tax=Longimycelium tulufanense TaxID=907463 RepID=A0A8J3C6L4_9PSEU|nr:GNAT family N-acetyltransferase [Longimycelium tulufanense]GGM40512.1 N-acetyltransferase [Longimycelium tulufanense]
MADVEFRRARRADVPAIVDMLADDVLGSGRERPGDPAYLAAFDLIDAEPGQLLVVAEEAGEVVGTLQLSFLPGLSLLGATRALVEAVRVRRDRRGGGLGERLLRWAVEEARRRGCALVQLTSNAEREDARRFYVRLGFEPSHVGFKLNLRG